MNPKPSPTWPDSDSPMSPAEIYQRRIDTMEWWPSAMTEAERQEKRRFEAYFAFETQNWKEVP